MKKAFQILTSIILLFLVHTTLSAQEFELPVTWDVHLIPQENPQHFQLVATAKIQEGFHIWGLDAGGDGSLINTEVVMDDDHNYIWLEKEWRTNKEATPIDLDYIEGTLYWFEKEVTLYRTIVSSVSMPVEGSIVFQVCNEQYCYPPETFEFKKMIPVH